MPARFDLSALSWRRSAQFALALLIAVVVVTLAPFIARAWRNKANSAAKRGNAAAQLTTIVSGISIDHLVPEGMPVVVSGLTLIGSPAVVTRRTKRNVGGPMQLKVHLQRRGQESLTSVNLMLFEFDDKGALHTVDGWVRNPDLTAAAEIIFNLGREIPPGRKLMMVVERVNSEQTAHDVTFKDLARTGNAKAVGKPFMTLTAGRSESPLPDDSGPDLCANAFRRAMSLAQDGDGSGITSFTCNQQDRSFRFSFNGKVLLP